MDKNKLFGWLLITMIFFSWFYFRANQEYKKNQENAARLQDSLALAQEQEQKPGKGPKNGAVDSGIDQVPEDTAAQTGSPELKAGINSILQPIKSGEGAVAAPFREIVVETNKFIVTLESKGASITSIILKDLKGKKDTAFPELLSVDTIGILTLKLDETDLSQTLWAVKDSVPENIKVSDQAKVVQFITRAATGREVTRKYTFFPDSHYINHEFSSSAVPEKFALNWNSGLRETEKVPEGKGIGLNYGFFSEVIINTDASVLRETFSKKKVFNESSGVLRWIGLRRKYVAAVINFKENRSHRVVARPILKEGESKGINHTYKLSVTKGNYESGDLNFDFVVLPLNHDKVLSYGEGYEKIVFSGYSWFLGADTWYPKLCGLVLTLLKKFYSIIPNYGIAIILLTLLVRLILMPLTISQTKSMGKVQEHAPAVKEIKAKYKGNPQRANKEVMAYYKEAGINPMAPMIGCLPMFLQLPVFISLFNVLGRAVELKEAPFAGWISDLSRPDVFSDIVQVPYLFPMGLTVLPFFMAVTMYFQMKMTITDPNQKAMVYMMPVMMFLFSASFPSGLVVYWTVSNVFTIGQTWMFQKRKGKVQATAKPGAVPKRMGKKKKKRK